MSLPVIPDHTISVGGGILVTIDAIQVGIVARVVPPGSVKRPGTVYAILIIILITSCKWLIAVKACEGVTSSS